MTDNSHTIHLKTGVHDKPEEPRNIPFGNIEVIRKRVIDASELNSDGLYEYYYDNYLYTFRYQAAELYASRTLFNEVDSSSEVSFCRYKPGNSTLARIKVWLEKRLYQTTHILFGKTRLWIYLNLYRPEQGEAILHKTIPYDDYLFREAVRYLVTAEGVKTVKILATKLVSPCGYTTVDLSRIIST